MLLTPAKIKPKPFESRRNFFFLPGMDASRVYVRAWALGCFHSQYPNLSEGAGQLRGDKECPFSGVTKSGRVWRKVSESDARSVPTAISSSVVFLLRPSIRSSHNHHSATVFCCRCCVIREAFSPEKLLRCATDLISQL